MKRYRAKKDVYCPHTGNMLFLAQAVYVDISPNEDEIVLQTGSVSRVSQYTITGAHCNMEGFFDVVVPETVFKRSFHNRKGGIGALTVVADRFNQTQEPGGVDITFTSGYHDGEYKYFACMGADTCREISVYMDDLARWIEESE